MTLLQTVRTFTKVCSLILLLTTWSRHTKIMLFISSNCVKKAQNTFISSDVAVITDFDK